MSIASALFLLGAVFLGWSFGRNNLSNLFGTAIGTRMLPLTMAACVAGTFVFLGAFVSGYATTENVNALAPVESIADAFVVCVSAGVVLYLLSALGVPASLAQTSTGALVAWNFFYMLPQPVDLLAKTILSWIYSPFFAGIFAFVSFYIMRLTLKRFPIRLLWRDHIIRIGLLMVGSFSAYALGANNIASIVGPYVAADKSLLSLLFFATCCAVSIGFLSADRRVIKTVSRGMFPLSPLEAFIVLLSGALTLFCFSSIELKLLLSSLSLPSFPLVPVPLSVASIGAIVGVALAKGIDGLKFKILGQVACSWLVAPVLAGVICYLILLLCRLGGWL